MRSLGGDNIYRVSVEPMSAGVQTDEEGPAADLVCVLMMKGCVYQASEALPRREAAAMW
jgi:hypothetical protein